ncbi:GlcG/HbpS family heme-binding protein [Agromyces bauzanensis]
MIGYSQARTIVEAGLAHGRENALPPMTVAVLGADGELVAFGKEDGSSLLREKIARGKAKGALNMGVGSRSLAARAATHPAFVSSLIGLAAGDLVPVAGGVLVRDADGVVVGAVGVSGHQPDQDEACAVAGILAAGLAADPGVDAH